MKNRIMTTIHRGIDFMKLVLIGVIGTILACAPLSADAQDRWSVEITGDSAFATRNLADAALSTGFGFGGSVGYRFLSHVSTYAGWDWHHFRSDTSFAGPNMDFEETGYAFGLRFEHPIKRERVPALMFRAAALTSLS